MIMYFENALTLSLSHSPAEDWRDPPPPPQVEARQLGQPDHACLPQGCRHPLQSGQRGGGSPDAP